MTEPQDMDMDDRGAERSSSLIFNEPLNTEILFNADDEPSTLSSTTAAVSHRQSSTRYLKPALKNKAPSSIQFASTQEYEQRLKADADRQLSGQPSELAGSNLVGSDAVAQAVNMVATKRKFFLEEKEKKEEADLRRTRSATRSSRIQRLKLSQPKPVEQPDQEPKATTNIEDTESSTDGPKRKSRRLALKPDKP